MNATPSTPGSRRRADARRNRERVLDAARAHLDAGEVDLPMNTIARTAGVGVGTAYRHFPSRQLLMEALAEAGLLRVAADIAEMDHGPDPTAVLTTVLLCLVHSHRADPAVAAILSAAQPESPRAQQLCADIDVAVGQVLRRREVAAALRTPVPPELLRALAVGAAVASVGIGHGRESELVATVVAGLLRPPVASRAVRYADVPFDRPNRRPSPAV